MTTLIIILPLESPSASTQFDYVLTPDGRTVQSQSRASLAMLPQPANAQVVAVVPAAALSWHAVTLPRGTLAKNFLSDAQSPRLRAILDGLLEEQVLDDPAHLHFALAPGARDDTPLWVAACDRAWLAGHLQSLEHNGRAVSRIVPEFAPPAFAASAAPGSAADALPSTALHVMGTPEDAKILFAKNDALMPLSAASVGLAHWPDGAAVLAEPAVAALAEGFFKRRVDLLQNGQRWLQSSASAWDLAQFDLASSGRSRSWKRVAGAFSNFWQAPRWKAARWSAAVLVVVNLLGLNAWAWSERGNLERQRLRIRELLTSTFPAVKVVVDAPVQMAREVALLRQNAGGVSNTDFEPVLEAFVATMPVRQAATAIEYMANEVRIKGSMLDVAELAGVQDKLKNQGITARLDGNVLVLRAQGLP
jgi:general secretion pathway protein L